MKGKVINDNIDVQWIITDYYELINWTTGRNRQFSENTVLKFEPGKKQKYEIEKLQAQKLKL